MSDDDLGICHEVRRLREGALPYWRPLWEGRELERDFLDGDRYEENTGLYNKDRRRQQFRGQEVSNVNRNKVAQATAAPRSLEALPVDKLTDADDAEIAVSIMEWELGHPQKGFDDVLEEVIQDAIDCRAGAALLDYDPDLGKFGECFWRWKDMNLLMWEPGFQDPHHLKCGWMQEARRMHMDDLAAMGKLKGKAKWYGVDDVVADGLYKSREQGAADPDIFGPDNLLGVPGVPTDDEHVWVLFCWYKNDVSTYRRQTEETLIPKGERYMGCDNLECDYRSDTQDELIEQGKIPEGGELTDTMEPCPNCGSTMSRRDVHSEEEDVLAYPKGRRLVVMPLFQRLPDDEPFYDGAWPVPTARSFPILYVTAYTRPGRPMGDSDTTRNWEAQVASDQLMTMAFDRIMRHQMYYVLPRKGMYDYRGQRFEFRDDQFNVMFQDMSDASIPPPQVQVVTGSALDGAWGTYWQAVQTTLLGPQGINDMGLTRDNSKNIAASTVAQLDQIGNIPVAHFIRRKNRALSKAYGVMWDYLRYTYKADRLARLRLGEEDLVVNLKGDELPNFDFRLVEAPDFTHLDKARDDAFQKLYAFVSQNPDPDWLELYATTSGFPQSIVRKVKQLLAKQQMEAEAGLTPGGPVTPAGAPTGAASNPFQMLTQGPAEMRAA